MAPTAYLVVPSDNSLILLRVLRELRELRGEMFFLEFRATTRDCPYV